MLDRLTLAAVVALLALPAIAEDPPACAPGGVLFLDGLGDADDDLARLVELAGEAPSSPQLIRRAGLRLQPLCAGASRVGWVDRLQVPAPPDRGWLVLPAHLETVWNSTYPSGDNDGLLWAGRGVSTQARLGVAGRWGAFSGAVAPEVAWQQNGWFETVPTGKSGPLAFQNPWYGPNLDMPQRFGAGPYATAALGQSYLRADLFGAAVGVSTENLWLGPGLRNAILLTNNAPGFPHAFLGTSQPADVWIGKLEVLALWGQLDRSRYAPVSGHPWFSALVLDFEPRWVPGLYLGLGRSFVETWSSLRSHRLLSILEGVLKRDVPGGDNPLDNQVASAWFRWAMPEAGLEIYGEWARDDFPISFAGLVRESERTQGWVWGFQKLLRAGDRLVRVQVESTRLHEARPIGSASGLPVWYVHANGVDYTHDGQILGAAAGPGGESQRLAVDVLAAGGRVGGFVERTRRNEEIFWGVIEPRPGEDSKHDAELAVGYRQVLFLRNAELAFTVSYAYRWNRDFLGNQPNVRCALQLKLPLDGSELR
jgi:hypothetical protein